MKLENEPKNTQKAESLEGVLNRLPNWENLPQKFYVPVKWGNIIKQLADKTIQEDCRFGVLGYPSSNEPQPLGIKFGELVRGDKGQVDLLQAHSFSAKIEIDTHPTARFTGKKSDLGLNIYIGEMPIPSSQKLGDFLFFKERLLSFVVLPQDKEKAIDIDVLVKCQETSEINSLEEYTQASVNLNNYYARFVEKITRDGVTPHLADWKIFLATVAKICKVGYYSSFNCFSAIHGELLSGKATSLIRVDTDLSFDEFLISPMSLANSSTPNNA